MEFLGMLNTFSWTKQFFWGGLTIFAPSDTVVQGHFQVVSVIWAPYKSNLGALLIVVSSLRGGAMAPSGLLLSSATTAINPSKLLGKVIK